MNATPTQPPILPPIQRLQPSPKLMSGASPDDPVRVPVKSMTPEQEDRRRREDEMAAAAAGRGSQGAGGYIWGQVSVPREGEGQTHPYSSFDETKKQLVGSGFRPQVGPGQQPQSQPGPQPELQQPPPRQQQQ
ncbi:conserved hypothetical protein [Histoplasma capsulatum H143]|nr:conserved hypothetical protein [Histoplasma capsulatum H143]